MIEIPEICCDTCPLNPTCEEEREFLLDALSLDEDFRRYVLPTPR